MSLDYALIERFWKKVELIPEHPCWEWVASKDTNGYGQIGLTRLRKNITAHRLSWEIWSGASAGKMCVLHTCDNPGCVRPNHLFLGTQKDNANDRSKKKRGNSPRGSSHVRAKIDEQKVIYFRKLYKSGVRFSEIAKQSGLSDGSVYRMLIGESWAHVSE